MKPRVCRGIFILPKAVIIRDTPQKCHFTLEFSILNFSIAGCPSEAVQCAVLYICTRVGHYLQCHAIYRAVIVLDANLCKSLCHCQLSQRALHTLWGSFAHPLLLSAAPYQVHMYPPPGLPAPPSARLAST
jgi:hypothetical protein